MPQSLDVRRIGRSQLFDLTLFAIGITIVVVSLLAVALDGWDVDPRALFVVPLIVLVAQFPVVTNQGDGGIEIGFDSAVLMFLVCSLDPFAAVALWSLGVVVTQLVTARRLVAVIFNIGVGITAGAIATVVLRVLAGPDPSDARELVGVVAAATAYFVADFAISSLSVALEAGDPGRAHLVHAGTWVAIAWFVPFDVLGYLGAVILRVAPWWMLLLLAAPLATLLIATRAINRGRENARRLQVLLDAAVNYQTLSEPRHVLDSLLVDATRLLRLSGLAVRQHPPGPSEVGAQIRGVEEAAWIAGPAAKRARSDPDADQRALTALAAVSAAAFNRLALTEDLVRLARFDSLTNLPNRAVFLDRLNYALMMARRSQHQIALLFVDLDGFKPVNDRFGHAAGDAVLVDVARRLEAGVRDTDTVARLGGDEFAVLFEEVDHDQVTAACERILTALSGGIDAGDHLVDVSASIGVAFGSGAEHADEVLRNADLAMYEAKSRGKARFVFYEPRMLTSRLDRLELVEALGAAVASGDLTVVYQPVILASTGHIYGVEALARWRHEGVDVPPDVFIRTAEETGLIVALGAAVLDQVSRDTAAISTAAGTQLNVAVNVSPSQLAEPSFLTDVREALDKMTGTSLVLEITEREEINHDLGVMERMRAIIDLGVTFAIDDFGVGFSSINYLREVPARIVKIDASLSQSIDRDPQARGLLRSIAMMSRALGHDVVVEGIERDSQLQLIRDDLDSAYVQGYLLHRPMRLEALLDVLGEQARRTATSGVREPPAPPALVSPGRSAPRARR